MKTFLPFLFFVKVFVLFSCSDPLGPVPSNSTPGTLDLSAMSWSESTIPLDGQWLFFPLQLLTPADFKESEPGESIPIMVPDVWNHLEFEGKKLGPHSYGTYRLEILLPPQNQELGLKINALGSAFRIWAQEREIFQGGRVATQGAQGKPAFRPQVLLLPQETDRITLTVQVSNFHHKEGGIWYSWHIGPWEKVNHSRHSMMLLEIFLFGSLLIMGIYNIGLFFHLKKDKSPLYFGLLSLDLGLRTIVYGEYFLLFLIPDFPWEILQKIGYLTLYLGPPLFYGFIHSLFPTEMKSWSVKLTWIVAGLFSLWTLAAPYMIYSSTLLVYQVWLLGAALYMLYVLLRAVSLRLNGANFFLMGFSILFLTVLNDILHSNLIIRTMHMVPFGIFAFIVFQAFVLTKNFSRAFHSVDQLSMDLQEINHSMARFVPVEFLRYLGKNSIRDVHLGDHKLQNMAVLFADIRSFTDLSENMSPEENFRFINSYLQRISPSIHKNEGFIDKFLGDGLMALFPKGPESAILAALDMLKALEQYNGHRRKTGYKAVKIGIGIHCGPLMMGTIGNNDRMDSTVIADAVNLASRLEGLNKQYHTTLIVSQDSLNKLPQANRFSHRFLGIASIKGKSYPVPIHEIFESDRDEIKQLKKETLDDFEKGVREYIAGNFSKAYGIFRELFCLSPRDRAATAYLKILKNMKEVQDARKKLGRKKTAPSAGGKN